MCFRNLRSYGVQLLGSATAMTVGALIFHSIHGTMPRCTGFFYSVVRGLMGGWVPVCTRTTQRAKSETISSKTYGEPRRRLASFRVMKKLPPLNERDASRLSKLVAGGHLIPVLNNTKWAELVAEMANAKDMNPQFRTRSVFASPGFVSEWDGEWHYHIHPVAELEWMELRAVSAEWLLATLRRHNIPFSEENGVLRVWGYTRPGAQPCWR